MTTAKQAKKEEVTTGGEQQSIIIQGTKPQNKKELAAADPVPSTSEIKTQNPTRKTRTSSPSPPSNLPSRKEKNNDSDNVNDNDNETAHGLPSPSKLPARRNNSNRTTTASQQQMPLSKEPHSTDSRNTYSPSSKGNNNQNIKYDYPQLTQIPPPTTTSSTRWSPQTSDGRVVNLSTKDNGEIATFDGPRSMDFHPSPREQTPGIYAFGGRHNGSPSMDGESGGGVQSSSSELVVNVDAELVNEEANEKAMRQRIWEELRAQAPSATIVVQTQHQTITTTPPRRWSRCCCFAIISAVIISLIVVVAVIVSTLVIQGSEDNPTPNPSAAPSSSLLPSFQPTMFPTFSPSIMPSDAPFWSQLGNDLKGDSMLDFFGIDIAISYNGTILAVRDFFGAGGRVGRVRVYILRDETVGEWEQLGQSIAGDTSGALGNNLCMSSNGTIIAFHAFQDGGRDLVRAYSFEDKSGIATWKQIGQDLLDPSADEFGSSLSLSLNGRVLAIGARRNVTDLVQVFRWEEESLTWIPHGGSIEQESPSEHFGHSIALSEDGSVLVISAPGGGDSGDRPGSVKVMGFNGSGWNQHGQRVDGDVEGEFFGRSVAVSYDGKTFASGGGNFYVKHFGVVRVFRIVGDDTTAAEWVQVGEDIVGSGAYDEFGASVALSSDGMTVAAGAHQQWEPHHSPGYARVFAFDDFYDDDGVGSWYQLGEDLSGTQADDDLFVVALSSDGGVVAVGAPQWHSGGDRNGDDETGYVLGLTSEQCPLASALCPLEALRISGNTLRIF